MIFRIRLSGFAPDAEGQIRFITNASVTDNEGKTYGIDSQDTILLTGTSTRLCVHYDKLVLDSTMKPGTYTYACSIKDNHTRDEVSFRRQIAIREQKLHASRLEFSSDEAGQFPASHRIVVGSTLYCWISVQGLRLDEIGERRVCWKRN